MKKLISTAAIGALAVTLLSGSPATAADYGTAPHLVRDIAPGAAHAFISEDAAVLGSRTVFAADATSGEGSDLWISDTTTAGTKRLKDFAYPDAFPENFTAFDGKVYFTAEDGVLGQELWVTDGTTAGTHLVADLRSGALGSDPHDLTVLGGGLYFAAGNDTGERLWRLAAGPAIGPPAPPVGLTPQPLVTAVKNIAAVGNRVAFSAGTAAGGYEPWTSGGTAATTKAIGEVYPGVSSSDPADFALTANGIVFRATTDKGAELWRSDLSGTPGSSALVKDIWPGISYSNPKFFYSRNGIVLFKATDATGSHLWRSDGTPGGTLKVHDVRPGSTNGDEPGFVAFGGKIYFVGTTTEEGSELWVTGGTTATTHLVKNIGPSASGGMPRNLVVLGGRLFFAADTALNTTAIWRTDGTSAGTVRVSNARTDWSPELLSTVSNTMVFTADSTKGRELWAYTTRTSTTKGFSRTVSKKVAANRKIYVTVQVRAIGTTPIGKVVLKQGSTVIGSRALAEGNAKIRITKKLSPGKHKIRAYYAGSVRASTSHSKLITITVK